MGAGYLTPADAVWPRGLLGMAGVLALARSRVVPSASRGAAVQRSLRSTRGRLARWQVYVRSHAPVPQLDAATHEVSFEAPRSPAGRARYTLAQLQERFGTRTVTSVIQCGGNRAYENLRHNGARARPPSVVDGRGRGPVCPAPRRALSRRAWRAWLFRPQRLHGQQLLPHPHGHVRQCAMDGREHGRRADRHGLRRERRRLRRRRAHPPPPPRHGPRARG